MLQALYSTSPDSTRSEVLYEISVFWLFKNQDSAIHYINQGVALNDQLESSDSFPDQFSGESGKKLKSKNFRELLIKTADLPLQEQARVLQDFFVQWKGHHEQTDDVCVIGISL